MIEVKIRPDEITLFGHANYAVAGQDIVCAGATALVQTLIRSIEDLTEENRIQHITRMGRYQIREFIRESKNSGGFLFCWHLYDR